MFDRLGKHVWSWQCVLLAVLAGVGSSSAQEPYPKVQPGDLTMKLKVQEIAAVAIVSYNWITQHRRSDLEFELTDSEIIRDLFGEIDYDLVIDGRKNEALVDAGVFIRYRGGEVRELHIALDYDYILAAGEWNRLYSLTRRGEELFRKHTRTGRGN